MDVKNNFVSNITLGNFNPAILSDEFLKKECDINLGDLIEQTPHEMPIMRRLVYKGIKIDMDLERFQVLEQEIEHIEKCRVPHIMKQYFKKLPYTPLRMSGINFNFTYTFDKSEEQKFIEFLASENKITNIVKVNKVTIEKGRFIEKEKEDIFTKWVCKFRPSNDVKIEIRVERLKQEQIAFLMNYNYEMSLKKTPVTVLAENYHGILKQVEEFVKNIEG